MRESEGESIAGFKIGCTSRAIQNQFGLNEPIHAYLFRSTIEAAGDSDELQMGRYLNCSVEPEMVIEMKNEVDGEGMSDSEIMNAIGCVRVGIELHHFRFWQVPPTSQELIASGGFHAGLIIGDEKVSPHKLNFKDELFRVYFDGRLVAEEPASEILGGPVASIRWLSQSLAKKGMRLKAGDLVIPGSPVALLPVKPGVELKIEIQGIGSISRRCVD